MLKDYPLISIISVNYNTTKVTGEFLASLKRDLTYPNTEVIIVDNASLEDPARELSKDYPQVKFIRSAQNLGFAGGNNLGVRQAKGEYLFLVNNDTEITPGLLEGLLEVFELHPDAGMVCPKFHYYFHKGTIEYAGYNEVNVFTGRNSMIGSGETDKGQHDELKVTHYAHGGAMLVSRKVLDTVGMMFEDFFLYYEELDWSEQVKRKGFSIYYQPKSLIYHKESMSTGKSSPLKTFYLTRNRILFMRRNMKTSSLLVFFLYFSCFTIPKNTVSYTLKGQFRHLRSFWRGILWHLNPRITFTA